ncbi:Dicer-like protein 2 [Ascosphaera pollenicola]|nr:Dicer-like protein 2 [Ascosphaera pollenicola]
MTIGDPDDGTSVKALKVQSDEPISHDVPKRNALLRPRAYQLEMFEATLRDNVIVSLVWFLAPTVVLAQQQHTTISPQLAQYQSRLLIGADNVEFWSTQEIWDAALLNIRIVISTPQILLDALSNGFIRMQRLSLIVFDEAHMAMKAAVSNRIMQTFYHPQLKENGTKEGLPHIMGLTASPITSRLRQMTDLENNLDAKCMTPHLHHEEMLRFVHRPKLELLSYEESGAEHDSVWINAIKLCFNEYDLYDDPDVEWLRNRKESRRKRELEEILARKKNPYCREQLRIFLNRAEHLNENLGIWASHRYIYTCIQNLYHIQVNEHMLADSWENGRELHLQKVLSNMAQIPPPADEPDEISSKVENLIKFLESQFTPGFSGIVFTTQRVAAKMLSDILALHPRSRGTFKTASVIGDNRHAKRQDRFELFDSEEQKTAVQDFREQKVNLIVATSVLEEGIDVSACHLVVTFDEIQNLRSFIQRRGRARKSESTFAIFLNQEDQQRLDRFNSMETLMKSLYADEMRRLEEVLGDESIEEDEYDGVFSPLGQVSCTYPLSSHVDCSSASLTLSSALLYSAYLSLANARPRLEHFCATLGHAYTDTRPEFILKPQSEGFCAKVILPTVLAREFREFEGSKVWLTQRMAVRDAAFQACQALHKAGLLNDRFLPMHKHLMSEPSLDPIEKRQNMTMTSSCQSPWYRVAEAWKQAQAYYKIVIEDVSSSGLIPRMLAILPVRLPCPIEFKIHWNESITLTIRLTPADEVDKSLLSSAAEATYLILDSVLSGRLDKESLDFSCLFLPDIQSLPGGIKSWCAAVQGFTVASKCLGLGGEVTLQQFGLASQDDTQHRPWIVEQVVLVKEQQYDSEGIPGETIEVPHVKGTVWPKRTDFTHKVAGEAHTQKKSYPLEKCRIAKLPAAYSIFALFIPAILHKIEVYLHADHLRRTILGPLDIQDLNLLVSAISSSSAREGTDYQRLEFLGDAALKLYASLQLAATKPQWHEGMLTGYKERIVSNHRLSAVAMKLGLDQYILVNAFTALKWKPNYNTNFAEARPMRERRISTKVLADVVEAIIGATIVDGGLDKAKASLKCFVPDESWLSLHEDIQLLYDAVPLSDDGVLPTNIHKIEAMIGYEFTKKTLLVEAMTHPSSLSCTMPYQRLEFIGDALLDHLITEPVFQCSQELSAPEMHLVRTTLANGDFLAFLCMKVATQEGRHEIVQGGKKGQVTTKATMHTVRLIQTLRHASPELGESQVKTLERFERLRGEIDTALQSSDEYPWVALCQIQAPKYMSDIIESLLAAIFVDSRGSWDECKEFLSRLGLMRYLDRALAGSIDMVHPKQRLGEIVGTRKVRYVTSKMDDLRLNCSVLVDDEEIASAKDALSEFEAETLAAYKAVAIWKLRTAEDKEQEKRDADSDGMVLPE